MILAELAPLVPGSNPLQAAELPAPEPGPGEILIKVSACVETGSGCDAEPAAGGRLVINAIRKEDNDKDELLRLNYHEHLWQEKETKSVANITGRDIREFLDVAAAIPIQPTTESYALEDANQVLLALKFEPVKGAKVLRISP